ncbi:MAG: type II toxin-antitoxin system HicA family toxin [Minisyncoccales bacterium]
MPKKVFSGKIVIKILCRDFGFRFVSQKGSHVKSERIVDQKEIITIVPLHKELSYGTFKGALDLAQVEIKDFLDKV